MGKISKEDLFREIGEIDEAYVEEAEQVRRPRRTAAWVSKTLAAAASLALCVGVGYGALQLMDIGGSSNSTADTAGGMQMDSIPEEYAMAIDEENKALTAEETGGMAEPEAAVGAEEERNDGLSSTIDTAAVRGEEDLAASIQQDEEEVSNQKEEAGNEAAQELLSDQEGLLTQGTGVTALTWEEALEDAAYGKYVDVQVPEGYRYTDGTRSDTGLHVIWTKEMEEISVSCSQADESVSDWLVDTDTPEEYDLSLYSIPWCDSIPGELYNRVVYATFTPEQITPEIVAARTYQIQEEGDVSGSRTQINILYSNNVLVKISSKGPSPEEIYAMINLEN